jgi:hypothetical protein
MEGIDLFIKPGFKIEKKKKLENQTEITYYEVSSPEFITIEVSSLRELTKEKYEGLKKVLK